MNFKAKLLIFGALAVLSLAIAAVPFSKALAITSTSLTSQVKGTVLTIVSGDINSTFIGSYLVKTDDGRTLSFRIMNETQFASDKNYYSPKNGDYLQIDYYPDSVNELKNTYDAAKVAFIEKLETLDYTSRVAVWYGKVNQYINTKTGKWETDPDGVSGARISILTYCQKWYPKTSSYKEYKKETITFYDRGNKQVAWPIADYTREVMSYQCVQEETASCTTDYSPVCGTDGRTYSNSCNASRQGVKVNYQGECKTTTKDSSLSDLIITDASIYFEASSNKFKIKATVKNIGNGSAVSSRTKEYKSFGIWNKINNGSGWAYYANLGNDGIVLKSGEAKSFSWDTDVVYSKLYQGLTLNNNILTLTVDRVYDDEFLRYLPNGYIDESNETNNSYSVNFNYDDGSNGKLPDLIVSELISVYTPVSWGNSTNYQITYNVKNIGDYDVDPNDHYVKGERVVVTGPDGTVKYNKTWGKGFTVKAGDSMIQCSSIPKDKVQVGDVMTITVDSDNKIKESNEANNSAAFKVTEEILNSNSNSEDIPADWKKYSNTAAGISLSYPESADLSVNASVKDLDNYEDAPLGWDLQRALADKAALAKGQFGDALAWSHPDSYTPVVSIGNINAKQFTILGQLTSDDVQFSKYLIFFHNNKEIVVYYGVKMNSIDKIKNSMPQYFQVESGNKNGFKIWKDQEGFLKALENNKGTGLAQTWHNNFNKIIKTINIESVAEQSNQYTPIPQVYQPKATIQAKSVLNSIKGKIVLQVEKNGEAYYTSPKTNKVYYLKDGNAAYQLMKETGSGINETDFIDLMSSNTKGQALRKRFAGQIVLRVKARGEAYYINPSNFSVTYMPDGNAAYQIMRQQGLGISNQNLDKVIDVQP